MDHDQTFRVILGLVFLAILPIGIYHRVTSQSTGEALDRRQEGLFILVTLRPAGALFWFGLIAWMLNPAWMAWSAMPLPGWTRWTGAVLAAAGAA
ncbi:MAG TPA: hypothetical protein VMN81_01295, partial [Vicinamibacterales bacterium]|nr:hypothetical protein [Vicinamibacterales bacterium]